jgi:hypothetical protein
VAPVVAASGLLYAKPDLLQSAMKGILLAQHNRFTILQISAHDGWNRNDPLATCKDMGGYFEKLSVGEEKESTSYVYVLVEASP